MPAPVDDAGPLPDSETVAFCLKLKPGHKTEYRKRHDELWPDMRDALLKSGILHYEIHLHEPTHRLFAFIVRRKDHTMDRNRANEIMQRWQRHMSDILVMEDGWPAREPLERMFSLRAP